MMMAFKRERRRGRREKVLLQSAKFPESCLSSDEIKERSKKMTLDYNGTKKTFNNHLKTKSEISNVVNVATSGALETLDG